jgi:dTDP-glucose pyrophosphorylase
MKDFSKHIISPESSIQEALQKLNNLSENLTLFVVEGNKVLSGTVTDGDIRRGLLSGRTLQDHVNTIMHREFRRLEKKNYTPEAIANLRNENIMLVPFLDEEKRLLKIINLKEQRTVLPLNAIIMAGGKGLRLKPLTDSVPKPLLMVGNKTIIEHTIDRLSYFGIGNIEIAVGYLGHKIEEHIGNGDSRNLNISYIYEKDPLGTIGAVKSTGMEHHPAILLMNSDLLTDINLEDFFKTFTEKNADMAVASVPYKQEIPYAVLEVSNGEVTALKEKPTYTYYSNAGIYLIKKELLDLIPENTFYNTTDLMEKVIASGRKLISYPILGYWLDIGKPDDFQRAQEDIRHLNLKN